MDKIENLQCEIHIANHAHGLMAKVQGCADRDSALYLLDAAIAQLSEAPSSALLGLKNKIRTLRKKSFLFTEEEALERIKIESRAATITIGNIRQTRQIQMAEAIAKQPKH